MPYALASLLFIFSDINSITNISAKPTIINAMAPQNCPSNCVGNMFEALTDSYKRLLFPSLERELRNELTEKAEKQAISVFAANLRQLLLTQPISGHTVLDAVHHAVERFASIVAISLAC